MQSPSMPRYTSEYQSLFRLMSTQSCVLIARGKQLLQDYMYYNYLLQHKFPYSVKTTGHEWPCNSKFIRKAIDYMLASHVKNTETREQLFVSLNEILPVLLGVLTLRHELALNYLRRIAKLDGSIL
jgi:hypothetical protein